MRRKVEVMRRKEAEDDHKSEDEGGQKGVMGSTHVSVTSQQHGCTSTCNAFLTQSMREALEKCVSACPSD